MSMCVWVVFVAHVFGFDKLNRSILRAAPTFCRSPKVAKVYPASRQRSMQKYAHGGSR